MTWFETYAQTPSFTFSVGLQRALSRWGYLYSIQDASKQKQIRCSKVGVLRMRSEVVKARTLTFECINFQTKSEILLNDPLHDFVAVTVLSFSSPTEAT